MESFNPKWAEVTTLKEPALTWFRSEARVLAALLSNWSDHSPQLGWSGLQYQIEPQHFQTPEAQFFYSVMVSMRDRAIAFEEPTVFFEEVRKLSKAKPSAVTQACLPLLDATTLNINYWARNLLDGFLNRELEKALREMSENSTQDTASRVVHLEEAIKRLKESEGFGDRKFVMLHQSIEGFIELLEKRLANAGKVVDSIETGWQSLDSKVKFGRGHFIVLGGRSGMGKTSFAFNLIHRMVSRGNKVGFFSMEHTTEEVQEVLTSIEAHVSHDKLKDNIEDLTEDDLDRITEAMRRFETYRLAISDKAGATIGDIKSEMEAMRRRMDGLDVVFIDHMHAIGEDKSFKGARERLMYITAQLKALANAFRIPVVSLAQMNRDADKRQEKRPQVSDLKESGSIEQDADAILFMYRDSYYAAGSGSGASKSMSIGGAVQAQNIRHSKAIGLPMTELIVRKNRHGKAQNFTLMFEYNADVKTFIEATLPE